MIPFPTVLSGTSEHPSSPDSSIRLADSEMGLTIMVASVSTTLGDVHGDLRLVSGCHEMSVAKHLMNHSCADVTPKGLKTRLKKQGTKSDFINTVHFGTP